MLKKNVLRLRPMLGMPAFLSSNKVTWSKVDFILQEATREPPRPSIKILFHVHPGFGPHSYV